MYLGMSLTSRQVIEAELFKGRDPRNFVFEEGDRGLGVRYPVASREDYG